MMRILIFFLMFYCILTANSQSLSEMGCGVNGCSHRNASLWKSAFIEAEGFGDWDLTYNKLEFNIDPALRYISGNVRFEFTSNKDQLDRISIDLSHSLQVDSIKSNDFFHLYYEHTGNKVSIHLKKPLNLGEHCCFKVYYQGIPSESGFGAFIVSEHNDSPIISTLSEPYGAMEWWPCKQSLQDKVDSVDIIVNAPIMYRTASNGVLVLDTIIGEQRINHWKHGHPIATYLVAISVTDYSVFSEYIYLNDNDSVLFLNYLYPEEEEWVWKDIDNTGWMMRFFSNRFLNYPFVNEKYGHAQFPWGGGMEHQTMSFMGYFQFEIIAHELAHQWFGDYITCGSWQDIWLNEGFATYLTGLCYEHFSPDFYWPIWKRKAIEKVVREPGGSVFVVDTTNVGRIFNSRLSYYKGSTVLHMLRGQIGDDAFFEGLRNYLNDERVANGFARTRHLKENLEQAADTVLTEFFNDWVFGEGYPIYTYQWEQNIDGLILELDQSPSVENGPFFEMKVPVFVYAQGNTSKLELKHVERNQEFHLNCSQPIDSIVIDPELWITSQKMGWKKSKNEMEISYKCFPNPVSEFLSIFGFNIKGLPLDIYNLDGKRVLSAIVKSNLEAIDVSQLVSGTYIFTIQHHNCYIQHKFIKL